MSSTKQRAETATSIGTALMLVTTLASIVLFSAITLITPAHYAVYKQSIKQSRTTGKSPVHKVELHNIYISDDNRVMGMSSNNRQYKLSPLFYYAKDYEVPANRDATVYVSDNDDIALMSEFEKTQADTLVTNYENSMAYKAKHVLFVIFMLTAILGLIGCVLLAVAF